MVIDKDNPDFVANWDRAVKPEFENRLVQTILDHLRSTVTKTNLALRAITKEAYQNLKKMHPSGAAQTVKDNLEEAEITRTEKAESRKRKRTERETNNNNKKTKKDN